MTNHFDPDSHILGTITKEARDILCPACDTYWLISGVVERGTFAAYENNDYLCPECGRDCEGEL